MKNFTFIFTLVLLLQFVNAQADGGYKIALANGGYKIALANGGYKNAHSNGGYKNAHSNGGYTCLDFSGEILPPIAYGIPGVDPGFYYNADACAIITAAQDQYFPDIILKMFPLDPNNPTVMGPLCFTTKFEGNLGGTPFIAIVNSGIIQNYNTLNGFNVSNGLPDMTAATAFTFNKRNNDGTAGRYLGTVYTRDLINDVGYPGSNPRESMTVVGGTGLLNRALGAFAIEGDAAEGNAPIQGKLCTPSKIN